MTTYEINSNKAAARMQSTGRAVILAVESSCDETAAAIVKDGRELISSCLHTQIPMHQKYGGVVPELASRSHVERVGGIVDLALEQAGMTLDDIDAIAVTCGPGLVGALLVGVSYAKALAYARQLPLIGVNHILGHVAANYISHRELEPPFICLVASGGHSHILYIESYTRYEILGRTRDDAAGEAFDKIARALGLLYPGGPNLERLAREGDPSAFKLPIGLAGIDTLDFSFSGLKTATVNLLHNAEQKGEQLNNADIAASFQGAVVAALCDKTLRAAEQKNAKTVALCGGVSANTALREALEHECTRRGMRFFCPPLSLCTDNAAMIGCAAYYDLMDGKTSPLSLNAQPQLQI